MYWFLDKLLFAYLFATAAFLVLRLFLDPVKQRTASWLNTANAIGALIIYIHLGFVLYYTFRSVPAVQSRLEQPGLTPAYHYDLRFGYTNLARLFLLTGLVPLFFLFRKFRVKVLLSALLVLLLFVYQYFDGFYAVMSSIYRDYLPSTWSVHYKDTSGELWWTIFFAALFFTNCWLLSGPKAAAKG